MISTNQILSTYQIIQPHIRRTPIVDVDAGDFGVKAARLVLKLESLQHAGSFKSRGAFTHLLTRTVPAAGVVAASGGNHGAAVAYAAMKRQVPAKIFVPKIASSAKIQQISDYGADLVIGGERYADALAASEAWVAQSGALPIHAFDQEETLLGQGTVGLELEEQAGDITTLSRGRRRRRPDRRNCRLVPGPDQSGGRRTRASAHPHPRPRRRPARGCRGGRHCRGLSRAAPRGRARLPHHSAPHHARRCWSPTTPSGTRSGGCGDSCASSPSPAARRRWRRSSPALRARRERAGRRLDLRRQHHGSRFRFTSPRGADCDVRPETHRGLSAGAFMKDTLKPGIRYRHTFVAAALENGSGAVSGGGRISRDARSPRHRLPGGLSRVGLHQGSESPPRLAPRTMPRHRTSMSATKPPRPPASNSPPPSNSSRSKGGSSRSRSAHTTVWI